MGRAEFFEKKILCPTLLLKLAIVGVSSSKKEVSSCIKNFQCANVLVECHYNELKSEEEVVVVDTVSLLESFSGQRAFIAKEYFGYKGSAKYFFVTLGCTLRKRRLYRLFEYTRFVSTPLFNRRHGSLRAVNKAGNSFTLFVKDFNIFFNMTSNVIKGGVRMIFYFKKKVNPQFYLKCLKLI